MKPGDIVHVRALNDDEVASSARLLYRDAKGWWMEVLTFKDGINPTDARGNPVRVGDCKRTPWDRFADGHVRFAPVA